MRSQFDPLNFLRPLDVIRGMGDVNGDGRDDLIYVQRINGDSNNKYLQIRYSTGTGFSAPVTIETIPPYFSPFPNPNPQAIMRWLADVNGDGKKDLVSAYSLENGGQSTLRWRISTGSGFAASVTVAAYQPFSCPFVSVFQALTNTGPNCSNIMGDVGDVNGDGREDLVVSNRSLTNSTVTVFLSNGTTYSPTSYSSLPLTKGFSLADVNGDKLVDLVSKAGVDLPSLGLQYHSLFVQLSDGNGFGIPFSPGTHFSQKDVAPVFTDINGDRHADIITISDTGNLQVRLSQTPTFDKITKVTNGLGVETQVTYAKLNDSNVYTSGAASAYPQRTLLPAFNMDVVKSIQSSNGQGGLRTVNYHYKHGVEDLIGRGFLGFAEMSQTDTGTDITSTSQYSQTYPFSGQLIHSESRLNNNHRISVIDNVPGERGLYNGTVKMLYNMTSTQKQYESNNDSLVGTNVTTTTLDDYGNATKVVVTQTRAGDTYTTTTDNQFAEDNIGKWHLGRLTYTKVTKLMPDGRTDSRESGFHYFSDTGLLQQEIIEPNKPALRLITNYLYDGFGNRKQVIVSGADITTRSTSTEWGQRTSDTNVIPNGRFAVTVTNAQNHQEKRYHDNLFGGISLLKGPNGLSTQYEFDNFGRQKKELRADNTQTEIIRAWCSSSTCLSGGKLKLLTLNSGSVPSVTISNKLGQVIRSATVGRNGQIIYTDTTYNALGQVNKKSLPYFKDETIQWHQFTYDPVGRGSVETAPDNSTTLAFYNGLVSSAQNDKNQINSRGSNIRGELIWTLNANDGVGGVSTEPDADIVTSYKYDPFGNQEIIKDAEGNIIHTEYNERGFKIQMTDPDMGVWIYDYNVLGELIYQKDAKGNEVTMKYDTLGRLTERTEVEGVSNWYYDIAANGIGKLARATGHSGDVKIYHYDTLGRENQVETQICDDNYSVSSTYDGLSRLETLTYPDTPEDPGGLVVRYNYTTLGTDNAEGYLKSVSNDGDTSLYWQATAQNAAGQLTEESLGNNLITKHIYDPKTGLIKDILTGTSIGNDEIQEESYEFDTIGNLLSRYDHNQQINGASLLEGFEYDNVNRMISSTVLGQSAKNYTYNKLGNILSKTGVGTYSYGTVNTGFDTAGPHAVISTTGTGDSYHYDANGNMTSGAGRTVVYSSYNKPIQITTDTAELNFLYGVDRNRILQHNSVTGNVRHYVGNLYERESEGGLTTHTHYIRAGGGTVATYKTRSDATEGTLRYLHKDHLGSIAAITDETGQIIEQLSYDPHGKRREHVDWSDAVIAIESDETDRGFTGHEHLDDVGLIHMNGRVYDPTLGRFMSADPYIQDATNSQSLNRYSYVLNNPLSYTDPSGFFFGKLFKGIFNIFKSVFKAFIGAFKAILNNKVLRTIAAVAISVFQPFAGGYLLNGFAAGYVGSGGNLKAGIVGALTAGAFDLVGTNFPGVFENVVAHGVVGGIRDVALGGDFGSGFLAGSFGRAFTPGGDPSVFKAVQATIAGGVGAVLGGGKFLSGALTAGMGYAFNQLGHLLHGELDGCSGGTSDTCGMLSEEQQRARGEELLGFVLGVNPVSAAAAMTSRFLRMFAGGKGALRIGDSFGRLGKVVTNPGIKIKTFDEGGHFIDAIITRGVKTDAILATMRRPRVVLEQARGRFLYVSDQAAVVVNQNGKAITTYGRDNFDDKILDILKKAGGGK